jgi:hypothetical protein
MRRLLARASILVDDNMTAIMDVAAALAAADARAMRFLS